jgi:hypothetical protein
MRRALFTLALVGVIGAAHAQSPAPADVGVIHGNPDVFKLLDSSKNWTPFGSLNPNTHIFSPATNGPITPGNCMRWGPGLQDALVSCGAGTGVPAFSEADLTVTNPVVGMAPGGADNFPFVSALMSAIGPSSGGNVTAYDVLFPGLHGQLYTEYYFSNSIHLTRGANYHCSGAGTAAQGPATFLIFAPGVDGVIEDSYNMTADSGGASGTLSACNILSMGYGKAVGNPIWNPNVLTHVSFAGDPAGILPLPTWHVGDSLFLTQYLNGYYPVDALLTVPPGTTVTAIDGATGNLTLSNPVTTYGASIASSGGVRLPGTATFTQTGSNNFSNGDTIQAGVSTFTFVNVVNNSIANAALIGPDFATSAANLVALIMHTPGEGVKYWPDESHRGANAQVTAVASGNTITFTSIFGGPVVNTFPSVYTSTGTAAGSFGGTHFTGAQDATNCSSPCAALNLDDRFFQFPASQAFKVQTTVGSNVVTVISGPRLLQTGDVIWSDAFKFGATVWSYHTTAGGDLGATPPGTTTPYQVTITGPTNGPDFFQNAAVTHAPGAEGNLWLFNAGEKRRAPFTSIDNYLQGWPIGMSMSCSDLPGGLNCDLSRDRNVWHDNNGVGRWSAGGNYATSKSADEQFAHNFIMDIWDGGQLGMAYDNPNSESIEAGSSLYGFVQNCANQNYSTILTAYVNGAGCAYGDILHPSGSGPLFIGSLAGPQPGVPELTGRYFSGTPFIFTGGYDNQMCEHIGDDLGGVAFAFSYYQCGTGNTWNLAWDPKQRAWSLSLSLHGGGFTLTGDDGYAGYNTGGVEFPVGVQLGNSSDDYPAQYRLLDSGTVAPSPTSGRLLGDIRFNQHPVSGGSLAWTNINLQSGIFLNANLAAGATTLTVTACPNPAPPVGTSVAAASNTAASLDQVLGTFASCSGAALTLQAGSTFASANGTALQFLQWRPAAPIANDAGGTSWTLGNTMTLTPITLASLPATCAPGTFAVINNGVAAPVYNAAVGATTGTATDPVFCTNGNVWKYH